MLTRIRAAAWQDAAEAQQFVATAQLGPQELSDCLEVLQHKALANDPVKQALRLRVFQALVRKSPHDGLFKPFVRALKAAAPELRQVLVSLLPVVDAPAEHGELIELLRAPDAELRTAAAAGLVAVAHKATTAQVLPLLGERGHPGLAEILEVVVRTSGAAAMPLLEKMLQRPDGPERTAAIRWLGDPQAMGRFAPAALRLLVPLLRDADESVVLAAISAVARLGGEPGYHLYVVPLLEGKNLKIATAVLDGLKHHPTEKTADVLERKLASGPNALRLAALATVEAAAALHADIDALLGVMVAGLSHSHIAVRNKAAEVLAALSRSEKVELGRTIVWLLRSSDVNTRRMAAEVLRAVPDPHGELWPKLIGSLRDDDWWVRDRVMDALVDLAGRGLSRYMVAWLKDGSDVVRRFALSVLLRLKDPETIAAVVHCARTDSDWWAREKAIEVIASFQDMRAVPVLVELLQVPELQMACIAGLKTIAPQLAASHLLPLASSPDADVRLQVLRFIEEQNDPQHAAIVEPLKRDPDPAVQRLAHALTVRWRLMHDDVPAGAVVPTVPVAPVVDADERPLDALLLQMVELGGADLIMAPERPVFVKRHGQVEALSTSPLSTERVASLLTPLVSASGAVRLEQRKDVDFSYVLKATGHRFRVNLFRQRGGLAAVFRAIPNTIPVLEELGLPLPFVAMTQQRNGLVLVGGTTGSGKSTTLAAFIDHINRTQPRHIVSLEDPIEVLHTPKMALVNQREVGAHTHSFARALKSALREDPDLIVVGELRDFETIALALSAAETGHLVVGTVHTVSADASVERIINAFPRGQQDQARASLADSLLAVLCQMLVRRKTPGPRLLASELLINTDAVANSIRRQKTFQIPSIVATSREVGMQAMDHDLIRLLRAGEVDEDDVLAKARNKREVEQAIADLRPQAPSADLRPQRSGVFARFEQRRAPGSGGGS